ncbi:MAG: 3-phosphoshikimate 1-carboxyvinyltransferase [Odoribacter sp.]|nr:3-phosphoshikimate 1-carboxyvinyltransferase [Odoribacter sp.]
MRDIKISFTSASISGKVDLPASKSISNRVLIINALAESNIPVNNLAVCDDTDIMLSVLNSADNCFDIGHAGTSMRFLTAFLSRIIGKWEITGSERMKQRPISVLVDALNQLGAKIEYIEKEGYPPLRIYGSHLKGGELEIPASISSQYISALMMIAPYMQKGLKLTLTDNVVSRTYIEMTAAIMREFGAEVQLAENSIEIVPVPYNPVPYTVESDWSGTSYFYELLAIAERGEIEMNGLYKNSLQGDAGQVEVWKSLGITTCFHEKGVTIRKEGNSVNRLDYDFVKMPDLVQSFTVACCLTDKPFKFSGVETLRIKETDRIAALIKEMGKLGFRLVAEGDSILSWDGTLCKPTENSIETYHDHRMAMAFAPAALKFPGLVIQDKSVVSKSFPDYWEQLRKLGMKEEIL